MKYTSRPTDLADALTALATWLEELGIPYSRPTPDYALLIHTPKFAAWHLCVEQVPPNVGGSTVLNAKDLKQATRRKKGWPVVKALLEQLGFQVWDIFDREELKEKKRLRLSDSFDDILFRHTVFRDCVNPPEAVMVQYKKDADAGVRRFYGRNRKLCEAFGFRREDLEQYAMIWSVNFHNTARVIPVDGQNVTLDNLKLLRQRIRQGFSDARLRMQKKLRNITPEGLEDAVEANYLDGEHNAINETRLDEPVEIPEVEVSVRRTNRKVRLNAQGEPADIDVQRRKTASAKRLNELLEALPAEKRVAALTKVAETTTDNSLRKLCARLLAGEQGSELQLEEDGGPINARSA